MIYEKKLSGKNLALILMIIIIFLAITIKPIYYSEDSFAASILISFSMISSLFLGIVFVYAFWKNSKSIYVRIMSMFAGLLFALPLLEIYVIILEDIITIIMVIIGIISSVIIAIFTILMKKRNEFGTEILGKIKGFKRFLETAEKPALEQLVAESPEYYYNILPYTYALGVSDKWMKKFEVIAMKAPDYYSGDFSNNSTGHFDTHKFNNFINKSMKSVGSSMTSSPSSGGSSSSGSSSTGSSSHSGGGSSGHGSGGRWRPDVGSLDK